MSLRRDNTDPLKAFAVSLVLHLSALFLAGWALMQPARYGMELGSGGLELYLVAAPPRGDSPAGDFRLPKLAPAAGPAASGGASERAGDGSSRLPGQDPATFYSAGGGRTEAQPGRLKNPAPPYPPAARRLGQQGWVALRLSIDQTGRPTRVKIERGSGYPLLDESALATVRRWQFTPARTAGIPVESEANLRVRFVLNENEP